LAENLMIKSMHRYSLYIAVHTFLFTQTCILPSFRSAWHTRFHFWCYHLCNRLR
jgi:hypothetical protein